MSLTGSNLGALIDKYVRNYPTEAFHNMALNNILHLLIQWIDSGGTTGFPIIPPQVTIVTSANFTTARNCPIPLLNGQSIAVFWIDPPKPLIKGTDWTDLAGGGFTMSDTTFDATAGITYTFWVFITT